MTSDARMDAIDRELILATQAGLPIVAEPYQAIGDAIGISAQEVIRRLAAMQERGVIRRIGVVPNHYALGYRANGMTVWDVDDAEVDRLGASIGALPFVSHCYRRPRRLPVWPYNLFAMVHGKRREEVEQHAQAIAARLGSACRANDILYSRRILKKTGMRLASSRTESERSCSE
jgi:DNA-binding Lrp family transcriptional regulator